MALHDEYTNLVTRTEPTVICRYATLAGNVVLTDAATFLGAMSDRDTLRVVTELLEVVETLRAWCTRTGVAIVHEDESRILTRGGCITEYELDLQCQPPARSPLPDRERNKLAPLTDESSGTIYRRNPFI